MSKASKQRWSCRRAAAEIIASILKNSGSLASLLPAAQQKVDEKDHALLAELCYGTLRHYFSLRDEIDSLLQKPPKEKDSDLLALLLVGSYQLHHMRIPAYAAINSCVEVTNELGKSWAKGLVNAVLRNIQRAADKPVATSPCSDEARFEHPQWLINELRTAWPEQAEQILKTNNTKAPMTLRVNALQTSRDNYLAQLHAVNISARAGLLSSHAIILEQATDVANLPNFPDGVASVQDEAAQLSAGLLQLEPSQRVLDACAAPGGKTCHMLEQVPSLQVTALDINDTRCDLIRDNLQRLKLQAQVFAADAADPASWWQTHCEGKLFDRILLDAPCSATGVIRHHPDIKLLRKADDITSLAATQLKLLNALWPLLKADGYLLYVTCSILPAENDGVLAQFLAAVRDAQVCELKTGWGTPTRYGKQLLPQENGNDGFYYCLLQKRA